MGIEKKASCYAGSYEILDFSCERASESSFHGPAMFDFEDLEGTAAWRL